MTRTTAKKPDQQPASVPASSSAQDDVDALAPPQPVILEFGAQQFTVKPLEVRQFFPLLQRIRPIIAALANRPKASRAGAGLPPPVADDGQGGTTDTDTALDRQLADGEWMLSMLEQHGPQIIEALAIGLDAKAEQLNSLTVVDIIVLCRTFITLNVDFFAHSGLVMPTNPLASMAAAANVVSGAAATASPTPPGKR